MIEEQVDVVVAAADADLVLPADEREPGAQLGQEASQPGDQGVLEVAFGVVGIEGQEVQRIRVLQDLPGLVRIARGAAPAGSCSAPSRPAGVEWW